MPATKENTTGFENAEKRQRKPKKPAHRTQEEVESERAQAPVVEAQAPATEAELVITLVPEGSARDERIMDALVILLNKDVPQDNKDAVLAEMAAYGLNDMAAVQAKVDELTAPKPETKAEAPATPEPQATPATTPAPEPDRPSAEPPDAYTVVLAETDNLEYLQKVMLSKIEFHKAEVTAWGDTIFAPANNEYSSLKGLYERSKEILDQCTKWAKEYPQIAGLQDDLAKAKAHFAELSNTFMPKMEAFRILKQNPFYEEYRIIKGWASSSSTSRGTRTVTVQTDTVSSEKLSDADMLKKLVNNGFTYIYNEETKDSFSGMVGYVIRLMGKPDADPAKHETKLLNNLRKVNKEQWGSMLSEDTIAAFATRIMGEAEKLFDPKRAANGAR